MSRLIGHVQCMAMPDMIDGLFYKMGNRLQKRVLEEALRAFWERDHFHKRPNQGVKCSIVIIGRGVSV